MSLFTSIRDNLVNVRKRDYAETVEMHKALETLAKKVNIGGTTPDAFMEKFFPDLPFLINGHFSFLVEKLFASSGLYTIQPLPEYEDTEALYSHREYIRGMTQVMNSFQEYEDRIFRLTHTLDLPIQLFLN